MPLSAVTLTNPPVSYRLTCPLSSENFQGQGPYSLALKRIEAELKDIQKRIDEKMGVKESDTGLARPDMWDLQADKQRQGEHPLQVARCSKIIKAGSTKTGPGGTEAAAAGEDWLAAAAAAQQQANPQDGAGAGNPEGDKYVINVKQQAKFVVGLSDKVSPTDIEEGMRVGVDRTNYKICMPLPPKMDATVSLMEVEEKPDVTYDQIGGCKEQIEKIKEVVETPLLEPEKFVALGIDPPKGVLLFGPPGTGKTLCARAVANRTDATFIRVIGSELVQKYVGEGARMVRNIFVSRAWGQSWGRDDRVLKPGDGLVGTGSAAQVLYPLLRVSPHFPCRPSKPSGRG